jgi:L-fuconolactonase
MKIIDSHVHFWNPQLLRYGWLAESEILNRTYLPDALPSSGQDWSIDGIVFVQADCAPEEGFQEAEWVATLAEREKRIAGIVAFAPLEQGQAVRPALEKLAGNPLVKGIRRLIQSEGTGFCVQPDFIAGVRLAAEFGFTFDICIRHFQLTDAIELVRQCPEVQFVLDHIGKPDIRAGQIELWHDHIRALADFPNVCCKISGLVTEADHQDWQPAQLQPYIDHILESFGPDRVMYGGDWPVVLLASDYSRWVETAQQATRSLKEDERQKFFYDNARAFYRLR